MICRCSVRADITTLIPGLDPEMRDDPVALLTGLP